MSDKRVAKGICGKCGGEEFNIYIRSGGLLEVECYGCEETWTTPSPRTQVDVRGEEAVAQRGGQPADVVSPSAGEALAVPPDLSFLRPGEYAYYQTMREAARPAYLERKRAEAGL